MGLHAIVPVVDARTRGQSGEHLGPEKSRLAPVIGAGPGVAGLRCDGARDRDVFLPVAVCVTGLKTAILGGWRDESIFDSSEIRCRSDWR